MNSTRLLRVLALCAALHGVPCAIPSLCGEARAQDFLADEIFASDPRIIEANALLEHRKHWKRSIELYREALADNPEELRARLFLARVLSWNKQYDEAFVEYYQLLDRQPRSQELRAEYAEVLSWAGRYDESERLFQELLAEDPENRRAALGLARVYNWSGRPKQAHKAYERVLVLAEDEEAREEYDALDRREGFGTQAKADSDFVSDNDGFQMYSAGANAATDLNAKTRVRVRAGFTNVSSGVATGTNHSNGVDVLAGVERRLGDGVIVSVDAGARRWSTSPNTALARAELNYTPTPQTAMGVLLSFGDFLERSLSFDSIMHGLSETRGRGWLWRELTPSIGGYGYFEASYISDSNARLSGGLSAEWKPWQTLPLNFGVAVDATTYTARSDLYYDPAIDVGATLFGHGALALHRTLDFGLRLAVGVGHARESAGTGTGFTYSVEGGPSWHYNAWQLALLGRHSQTIRGTPYMSHSIGVNLGRGF